MAYLCASVVVVSELFTTTEAQRTQRLHREIQSLLVKPGCAVDSGGDVFVVADPELCLMFRDQLDHALD